MPMAGLARVAGRPDADHRAGTGVRGSGGRLASARRTHDTWVTLFTSGSTGEPGAIDKRLAQLDAEVHTLQQAFGARLPADVRVLSTVSAPAHLRPAVHGALAAGGGPSACAAARLALP